MKLDLHPGPETTVQRQAGVHFDSVLGWQRGPGNAANGRPGTPGSVAMV